MGKTVLAERLSARLDATVVLDERENPFIHEFYQGRTGAAFQAQLFFTLARYRQQGSLRQSDLFSQLLIANYLFDRDKIYAYVNLDDNELFIYQRLYDLIAPDVPPPDLVIYLQTPVEVVRRRLRERAEGRSRHAAAGPGLHPRAERGLQPLLLPLHGEPAAHGRDVPRRSDLERRDCRRHRAADTIDGEGHAILRSQDAITGCHRCFLQIPTPPGSRGARRASWRGCCRLPPSPRRSVVPVRRRRRRSLSPSPTSRRWRGSSSSRISASSSCRSRRLRRSSCQSKASVLRRCRRHPRRCPISRSWPATRIPASAAARPSRWAGWDCLRPYRH